MTSDAIKRIRLPGDLPEPLSHYADAVRAGDTLWISGMLAFDAGGELVGAGQVVEQTEQVFRNIQLVLNHSGADFGAVVKVVVYLRSIDDRAAINEVRKRYFGDARPASTLVEVSALAHPDALVEIDSIAHMTAA